VESRFFILRHHIGNRSLNCLILQTIHDLNDAIYKALADIDAIGDADQIGIFELNARTLVAVVEKNIEASRGQIRSDLLTCFGECRVGLLVTVTTTSKGAIEGARA